MKAILELNMPDTCRKCDLVHYGGWCPSLKKHVALDLKYVDCPLKHEKVAKLINQYELFGGFYGCQYAGCGEKVVKNKDVQRMDKYCSGCGARFVKDGDTE